MSRSKSSLMLAVLLALGFAPYWFNNLLFISLAEGETGWPVYLVDYLSRVLGVGLLFAIPSLRALALPGEGRALTL